MPEREIKAVFFDAVGTLIHPDPAAAVVYAAVGAKHGSRCQNIAARFAKAFAAEEEIDRQTGWQTSEAREKDRWRRIVARVFDDLTDTEACFKELYERFAHANAWCVDAAAGSVLSALRHLQLGIASNYDHRLRSILAESPELEALKHVVISSEAGWRKPARPFFEAILKKVALPADQIVYVGDDLMNDHAPAHEHGMRAILFDPEDQHIGFAGGRISALSDLPGLLARR